MHIAYTNSKHLINVQATIYISVRVQITNSCWTEARDVGMLFIIFWFVYISIKNKYSNSSLNVTLVFWPFLGSCGSNGGI